MTKVFVVGSINTDLVARVERFPEAGETVLAESFQTFGGGKGANQAVAAARLDAEVLLVGAVGTDSESQARLDALGADSVDCSAVRRVPGHGGMALIEVERLSGQNRITLVSGANGLIDAEQVEAALRPALRRDDVVCCQLEISLTSVAAALRLGRATGARTVLNAAPAGPGLEELLRLTDLLIVNEIEAGQLLGRPPLPKDNAAQGALALRQLGPSNVVVTFGAGGAYLSTGNPGDNEVSVAAPSVSIVDTTGAGDALVGAVLARLAAGDPLEAAVAMGVAAGSFSVQREGAQPSFPTASELRSWRRRLAL